MKKLIFRFTVKLDGKIQECFVESVSLDSAKQYLAKRLSVDVNEIRHNDKNLSFNKRKDLLANPQNYIFYKDNNSSLPASGSIGITMNVDYLKTAKCKIEEIDKISDYETCQSYFTILQNIVNTHNLQNEIYTVSIEPETKIEHIITIKDMCDYLSITKNLK